MMFWIGLLCLLGASAAVLAGRRYPRARWCTRVATFVLAVSAVVLCSIWYPG